MNKELQFEEIGLMPLDAAELTLVEGGDTVNTSYYGGEAHYTWAGLHMISDLFSGFTNGLLGH